MSKKITFVMTLLIGICSYMTGNVHAGNDTDSGFDKSMKDIEFSVLSYFDYSNGQKALSGGQDEDYNQFRITRGYFTVKKSITSWMGMRATLDVHQDDSGDYKYRNKYLYGEFKPGNKGPFTNVISEIGIGHMPWLDFEEHINPYRCQGTMAIERAGIFNSADAGISLRGYFGGELADAEDLTGTHYYTGLYGSWHMGVYNGSGYHASENNENKAFEARVTVRPLPEYAPGLQISYFTLIAEGNDMPELGEDSEGNTLYAENYPDYNVHMGMISYEHPMFTFTGQYYVTEGNKSGSWYDENGNALDTEGYSFFVKVNLPDHESKFSVFGRYDYFNNDPDNVIANNTAYEMTIAGVSYDIYKGNIIVLAYETTDYEMDAGGKGKSPYPGKNLGDEKKIQIVYQIKF